MDPEWGPARGRVGVGLPSLVDAPTLAAAWPVRPGVQSAATLPRSCPSCRLLPWRSPGGPTAADAALAALLRLFLGRPSLPQVS